MSTKYASKIEPLCRQSRTTCISITPEGFCKILTDTDFGEKKCPFYKDWAMKKGVEPRG